MFEDRVRAAYPLLQSDDVSVLSALFDLAPIQARTLAKRAGMAQSSLFRCLATLEEAGLIETQAGDDPLRRIVTLTEAAAAFKSSA